MLWQRHPEHPELDLYSRPLTVSRFWLPEKIIGFQKFNARVSQYLDFITTKV